MLRHWKRFVRLIPWFALALIAAAAALLVARPARGTVRISGSSHSSWSSPPGGASSNMCTANYTRRARLPLRHPLGPSPTLSPLVPAWSALCLVFARRPPALAVAAADEGREPAPMPAPRGAG